LGDLYYMDIEAFKDFPNIPKIWVYWNHCDWIYMPELLINNLHLKTFDFWWLTFWWFQGCMKYKNWRFQYTQEEAIEMMANFPKVDVFISHCPPFWINDDQTDHAHIGFTALKDYIDNNWPKYFFHGHTYNNGSFTDKYNETNIVYVHREKIMSI
jgi:sensor histidine kinase YesM